MNPSYQPTDKRPNDVPPGVSALEHRLPRIAEQACKLWGSPAIEPFISSLMMDSRDGARQGLPWDVGQELLFLLEISIAKRAIVASQTTGMPYREVFKSMRTNAEEAARSPGNNWSNPSLNNDSRRVGPELETPSQMLMQTQGRSLPRRKPKTWWQRLLGKS